MNRRIQACCALLILVFAVSPSFGQENDDNELDRLYQELDSLFSDEAISGDLFKLADSILALEKARISMVSVRAGYVSEVVTAGRTFGINQFGFNPAIYYYHHTGFYGGVTGYWSNEYTPGYYLTDLSVGYMHTFRDKVSLIADHSFYIYNDSLDDHAFSKGLQGAASYQFKVADLGVDYSYLYGDNTAHRATVHGNLRLKKKFKGWIDAVTFLPGVAAQWGNADILYWRQPRTALTDLYGIVRTNDYPRLTARDYLRLYNMLENDREQAATYYLLQRDYTPGQIAHLVDAYYEGQVETGNSFGFMNLSISFPVIIRAGRLGLLLNYTYNLPYALPGESYTYDPSGYFSTSISYSLSWLKK